MAKLQGAAKAAFLARMNKGRVKAGLKRIGSKTKTKVKSAGKRARSSLSRSKRSRSNVAMQKTRSRHRKSGLSVKQGFKGFLAGAGAGELAEEFILLGTNNPIVTIPAKLAASAAGGYYVGKESGLIGGLAAEGLNIALRAFSGGPGQNQSRFRL